MFARVVPENTRNTLKSIGTYGDKFFNGSTFSTFFKLFLLLYDMIDMIVYIFFSVGICNKFLLYKK